MGCIYDNTENPRAISSIESMLDDGLLKDKTGLKYTVSWNSSEKYYDVVINSRKDEKVADFKMVCKYKKGDPSLEFYDKKSQAKWNFIKQEISECVEICESQSEWDTARWGIRIQIANDLIGE